jgi:peroxiredoxin
VGRGTAARGGAGRGLALAGLALALGALAAPGAGALGAGDTAPQFTARALEGAGQLSLADYRGKLVYLDFWASWCPPCLVSLPALEALRQEYAARGFEVVAVNLDRDLEQARRFLRKNPVGYKSASDPEGRIPRSFEVETMPTSFLIDRNGVVQYVHEGFRKGDVELLRERIEALLGAAR